MTNSLLAAKNTNNNQSGPYTSLDAPEIVGILAHINEEHIDELLGFLGAFTPLSTTEISELDVQLTGIYAEGITISTRPKTSEEPPTDSEQISAQEQVFFIAFAAPISQIEELQAQYILLKQKADKKLGKKTIKLTKQVFDVRDSYMVSKNMLRLELSMHTSPTPNGADGSSNPAAVPTNEAGYAYLFDLEHNISNATNANANKSNDDDTQKRTTPNRSHCYYTLRKAWQTSDSMQAWVDVYLHGDTPGGNWASALKANDTVITKREFPEKIEHLQDGQALLVVDETSMPTAARLLELWDNPKPPLIICVTQDAADQQYFNDIKIGSGIKTPETSVASQTDDPVTDNPVTVLPIIIDQDDLGQSLASTINTELGDYLNKNPLQIDKVWGALEAKTAKALRPLLRERLQLSRTDAVIKVYWRHD
ncbi:MAG: SIP domain-containing protein [Psychrobacter sp.]|uniref:SIP domain-containing protein n=1 Tax=Psychrobacter sp. TaxID=56811 RepID=UPI0026497CEC|nr:SIP domain-containing protein [Psychrobacter sp.]MDN6308120.1 SIP domain-containing protein [Psychrobacter sp.]